MENSNTELCESEGQESVCFDVPGVVYYPRSPILPQILRMSDYCETPNKISLDLPKETRINLSLDELSLDPLIFI